MGRILFLAVLLAAGWYCYTTGIYYVLTHDNQVQTGRTCEVVGPVGTGVPMTVNLEDAKFIIDVHIGTSGQKVESNATLNAVIKRGDAARLEDHTTVTVLDNGTAKIYGNKYPIVQVSVLDGDNKGAQGWVERENVMDTPLEKLYQSMRGTTLPKNGTMSR